MNFYPHFSLKIIHLWFSERNQLINCGFCGEAWLSLECVSWNTVLVISVGVSETGCCWEIQQVWEYFIKKNRRVCVMQSLLLCVYYLFQPKGVWLKRVLICVCGLKIKKKRSGWHDVSNDVVMRLWKQTCRGAEDKQGQTPITLLCHALFHTHAQI